jgi:hypothetical protein
MSDDQFTQASQPLPKRFNVERSELVDTNVAAEWLTDKVRNYHNESMALSHNFDKLREAVLQIARETGIKLQVDL